jgi:hypothetical protein
MANEKINRTITLAEAKAFAERSRNEFTVAEVQAAFDKDDGEIERFMRLGLTIDEAVFSAIVNMNLHMD